MKEMFITLIILTFNLIFSHISNYDHKTLKLSIRQTQGDINEDGDINIQDVVLLVNLILNNEYNDLVDMNVDDILNVIDAVQLVNIILIGDNTLVYSDNPDMNGQFLDAVLINRNPDCRAYALDENNGNYGSTLIFDIAHQMFRFYLLNILFV